MNSSSILDDRNPFATRYVRPGAIPFRFEPGIGPQDLVDRLAAAGWRGQIVGPHGSGKSTLLATLLPLIESSGRHPLLITLHEGDRRLPVRLDRRIVPPQPAILVVDGYEQLGRWHRWRLDRRCQRQGWGLLATAHGGVGLPAVFETRATVQLAQQIVAELAPDQCAIEPAAIVASFHARAGNLREVLFDCYDLHRRRECKPADRIGRP
jgi:energy-coupling factor transporter ATP-binding protein EcfA2